MKKRALISVSDKTGVVEFASELEKLGYEIVSTGGTFKTLSDAGIKVVSIDKVTGFPECLDGRVKTLHPLVHAGILAIRDNDSHMKQIKDLEVTLIDIVAINLYPFKQTILKDKVELEEAIENIDIGGPTMIRAAAKNYQDVSVLVDPEDYKLVVKGLKENGEISKEQKMLFALKVFEHTAAYDALICNYLRKQTELKDTLPDKLTLTFEKVQDMRYGENPHQSAAFFKEIGHFEGTIAAAEQLHGKELSYNNINDANGALDLVKEFDVPCVVAVKHANPCGVGLGKDIFEAYVKAHDADPVSIYGGIIACNREVDEKTAAEINKIFIEIVIAPSFSKEALDILTRKKNIRLLNLPQISLKNTSAMRDMKKVAGGILVQELDATIYDKEKLTCVTKVKPTKQQMKELEFAFKIVKHTKSNGIVLVKDDASVGIGPGQTNRITAFELAINYAGDRADGAVMGSDAFLPFGDCVDAAYKAGIKAIIQPGGSINDEDSIKKCDEYGIAMVFTGVRHFKH